MIGQQSKEYTLHGEREFDNESKEAAPCLHSGMAVRTEGLEDPSDVNVDDAVSDSDAAGFRARQFHFLKGKHLRKPVVLRIEDRPAELHPVQFSDFPGPTSPSIRTFIGGLSHCYNNLLMGIWGHATLIGMVLEKSDPFQSWLSQLEDLIQNGSNLMQLLFGYIAERRAAARQLRYKQLVIELDVYGKNCGRGNEFDVIEDCINELSQATTRPQMSANIARVIDRMQFLLQVKRSQIDENALDSTKAGIHLEKIDELIQRGVSLILNLQYYAGVRIPVKKPVCLRSMIQRKAELVRRQDPTLRLTWKGSTEVPCIDADKYQVEHVVDQLLKNAIESLPEDGRIVIELNTLHSEAPQDRCGVHMLKDYAVITFRDTGKGMTTPFQSQIFEPFFTGIKGQGRAGLGLAAAAGIIRSHGGYIQVRSKAGEGSTFKIYLPIQ